MAVADLLLNILSRSDRRAIKDTADELDRAGRKADDAGKSFDGLSKDSGNLDRQIAEARKRVQELGAEFDRTGVRSAEFKKNLRVARSDLSWLEKLKKDMADVRQEVETPSKKRGLLDFAIDEWLADGVKKASAAGANIANSIGDGIAKNPIVSTAVTALVIAATPTIVAGVGSAVAAGVGLGFGGGVIASGIALAAKDARVATAWTSVFDAAKRSLDVDAGLFVEPLERAAARVGSAWAEAQPHIDGAFRTMAPLVDQLSEGVAGFISNVSPAFDTLATAAVPFIETLAEYLPELGEHLGGFADSIAEAGPGALMFFNDMLDLVSLTIDALGWLTVKGSQLWQILTAIGQVVTGDFKGALQTVIDLGKDGAHSYGGFHNSAINVNTAMGLLHGTVLRTAQGAVIASGDFAGMIQKLNETKVTADSVAAAMTSKLFDSMMGVDQATLGFAESQTRVTESIKQSGLALDIHTAKGQSNREAILAAVQANMASYQANIAVGMSAQDAAKAYDDNTAALEAQLRQAGFTQGAIDGLVGKYRNVPGDVNTNIATKGLTEAIQGLEDVIRRVNGLDGRVATLTVEEVHRTTYTSDVPPSQFFRGMASGGRVGSRAAGGPGGGVFNVGENGPEQVVLPPDAVVIPNHRLSAGGAGEALELHVYVHSADTGEVVQEKLLRLGRQRGYRSVGQLLPVGA